MAGMHRLHRRHDFIKRLALAQWLPDNQLWVQQFIQPCTVKANAACQPDQGKKESGD